jgi:ABC-type nitrate/sulfonate/bicarbonate transport system substrate-binding protein
MKAKVLLLVGIVAVIVSLGQPAIAGDIEIKIGWQPASFFEFFLAREDQLFEKAGLKPTYVKFLSGPAMFAALKSGDVDVTFGGTPPFVHGLAQDLDIAVFFWSFTANLALIVRPDSGIAGIPDLANRKVATVLGSSAHYNLMELLTDNKIAPSQVQVLNMQVNSLVPAFAKGDIPAAMIWEPWGVKLTAVGGKRIGPYSGYNKYSQTAIYWGRRKWMEENAEAMKRFLGVIDESMGLVRKDPARGAKALARQTGLDESEALEILKLGIQTYVRDMKEPLDGHPLALKAVGGQKYSGHVESLARMAEFLERNGNIKTALGRDRLAAAHAPQFLEAYLKERAR